jgi:hypothetical protein
MIFAKDGCLPGILPEDLLQFGDDHNATIQQPKKTPKILKKP